MTATDAAPLPPAAVAAPRALLAELAAAAGHRQVPVGPVEEIRAGRHPASGACTVTRTAPDRKN